MKQRLRYLVVAGASASILVAGPLVLVHAEDTSNSTEDAATTSTTLKQRIEEHKNLFRIKLNAAEILALKGKCGSAQTKVRTYQTKVNANVPARVKAYQNLHDHLERLVSRLKDKGIDTATLEQQLTTLDEKIQTFKDDLATYKQDLSDLKDVDCIADPDGFQAALEAARADREKLSTDTLDIKSYVKDTIKPTLQQIRDQLKAQEESN